MWYYSCVPRRRAVAAKAKLTSFAAFYMSGENMRTRKLTVTGLLIAISVLLPQIFHILGGSTMGPIFLPMHLGIFLIGFIVGGWHGIIAGLIAPVISFAFSGMPPLPILFFMMAELAVYGAVAGFLRFGAKSDQAKWSIYPRLIIAMIAGRVAGGLTMYVAALVFKLPINPLDAVVASTIMGLPGIALQIVLIPAIYLLLKRGGYTFGSQPVKTRA